jgi:hypothetical protein
MTSEDVRKKLVEALELDCIGPREGLGDPTEQLAQWPSRWYLTGYLIPSKAPETQRFLADAEDDEFDAVGEREGLDDERAPDRAAGRQRALPSSVGLSFLVRPDEAQLTVTVRWGDYTCSDPATTRERWTRRDRKETVPVPVGKTRKQLQDIDVPNSDGLRVGFLVRPVGMAYPDAGLPAGCRAVSVFLINRRTPRPDEVADEANAFQVELTVEAERGFVARPDLRTVGSEDQDDLVADLQYRDAREYATGHNVATQAETAHKIRTCWLPQAEVERVVPGDVEVELKMDALAGLADGPEAGAKLLPLVAQYRVWMEAQRAALPATPAKRHATGLNLLQQAEVAAKRIADGIQLLADPQCLLAFRLANEAMAMAARQRFGVMQKRDPKTVTPTWRPFQLAFVLMNLPGIARPETADRETVDLLFFPTGGGKTEAYLGLAAFTLILRRLRNPGYTGAGMSVLMRYTLRLLTLDQLGRASTLVCALELMRQRDVTVLGDWPFEIGLWVGSAATPNHMGSKDFDYPETARRVTRDYQNNSKREKSPLPIEECPWCGAKFGPDCFTLEPPTDYPLELQVRCSDYNCVFSNKLALPIIGVDEQLYRRLPCFLIATVDKFAGLPWEGRIGAFFGRVSRFDKRWGFYGPCDSGTVGSPLPGGELPAPDLIIQDELHLISGPLGTMVGLYETAVEELCVREVGGRKIRPKIVASTATVRRADHQIRALFNRMQVDLFPPPGPDRLDSFFARTEPSTKSPARLYVGIAAQGKSQKVVMLRAYRALLSAAQKLWLAEGGAKNADNPVDPYMTLLGYFNALRELGGARRLVEDEVLKDVSRYSQRKRPSETVTVFADREIRHEPVELTSRVMTPMVAEYKRKLGLGFHDKDRVDVALATNMISVGLDISRLGLMVVYSQPKSSAEYIQATSRVGRQELKPGLVVNVFNLHKPRDRSHYEKFCFYHDTFYRSVEATSVTPFSPRAMDRGLAATVVGLARQGVTELTPKFGASKILDERARFDAVVETIAERAHDHRKDVDPPEDRERLRKEVRARVMDLLECWSGEVVQNERSGTKLPYSASEAGVANGLLQKFLDPALATLPASHPKKKFRANRSLRDVEAPVNLWILGTEEIEEKAGA